MFGIFYGGFNSPLWYLSVLIFGGFLIFEFLKRDEDLYIKILGPIIVIITFGIIKSDDSSTIENWKTLYGLYLPFWRGISDITIGCIISKIFIKYKDMLEKKVKRNNIMFYIIEIYSYVSLIYLIINDTNYDMYCIIYFSIIIICCNLSQSLSYKVFNKSVFKKYGKISLAMYFNHLAIIMSVMFVYKKVFGNNINNISVTVTYFCILIIYSIVFNRFIEFIEKTRKKLIE